MLTFDTPNSVALSREDVKDGLADGTILLVDVREPAEFREKRIPGSLSHPFSAFDPHSLPTNGRRLVFTCSAGVRSLHAAHEAHTAGVEGAGHYQGGIEDWETGGEPIERG